MNWQVLVMTGKNAEWLAFRAKRCQQSPQQAAKVRDGAGMGSYATHVLLCDSIVALLHARVRGNMAARRAANTSPTHFSLNVSGDVCSPVA